MSCSSCSMPTIEGFTQQNAYVPSLPSIEGFAQDASQAFSIAEFNAPTSLQQSAYTCQTQPVQVCVYTAQGEVVCNTRS